MYIIAIAWLYVVLLMAITEKSLIAGLLTFIFYGLLPCALLLWLLGTRHRQRYKQRLLDQHMGNPDCQHSDADE